MRHLLGRAALLACALALFSQPSSAVPVPKIRPHHHAAKAADAPTPQARPARDSDDDVTVVALAGVPVPTARPAQADDQAADEATADNDADNLSDDDRDADAAGQLADALPQPDLDADDAPRIETPDVRLNCVAFARERTGFAIQGDAHLWWEHAYGFYARSGTPSPESVMVFAATRHMRKGHVAVVTRLVSDREVIVDHANWLRDGRLYLDIPVADVSPDNDWSQVRVWNPRTNQWGARTYPLKGFVSARPAA
ncbi:MAG TPA: CHAP domain-containing protein [Rhizomicrobium sp.]|nr:CHAP domain-containing protein [Rhizomicrobium sp.]